MSCRQYQRQISILDCWYLVSPGIWVHQISPFQKTVRCLIEFLISGGVSRRKQPPVHVKLHRVVPVQSIMTNGEPCHDLYTACSNISGISKGRYTRAWNIETMCEAVVFESVLLGRSQCSST